MNKLPLFIFLLLLSITATARSLRCGGALVKTGDSLNLLTRKCGNPLRKFTTKETFTEQGRTQRVSVSNWVYARNGKKDKIVALRKGLIIRIRVD